MNDSPNTPEEALPKAQVKRRRWLFSVVWVVPVVAALVAGYLVYDRVREFGPKIAIKFRDASGVRAGQTEIKYRGVPVGQVTAVELSKDQQHALVTARLRRAAVLVASDGSIFWIVRPEVGLGNITGLGTVIAGPYIEVLPGAGESKSQFVGLDTAPVALERKGLKIVLLAGHLGSVKLNSPVYYRGIEVGTVEDLQLRADATMVEVHVFIRQRYATLVRSSSKFWNVSGVDVQIGLLRGLEINMESLKSLIGGGVAFATPDDPKSIPAKSGMAFPLFDEPRKEWLHWMPKIQIPQEK